MPKRVWFVLGLLALLVLPLGVQAQDESLIFTEDSFYLTMRDDVQIGVFVLLPADYEEGTLLPTVICSTRYLVGVEKLPLSELLSDEDRGLLHAGYAVVLVQARGSGISSGSRSVEWSSDEVADLGEVVDWIVAQPWSNGRVGGQGISYDGNTAELLTVPNHPAVKAVAPLYDDFDPWMLAMPGGVYNAYFIEAWSAGIAGIDAGDFCALADLDEAECAATIAFVGGLRPVATDPDGTLRDQFIQDHHNFDVAGAFRSITFRDESIGLNGETLGEVSPYGLREAIERSGVPMYIRVGWLDAATADGAISRFLTFSNPQQVFIGPWDHGGGEDADPFLPSDTPVEPSVEEQVDALVAFFDRYLRGDGEPPESSITYYTLNAGTWDTTTVWPPEGVAMQRWYFDENSALSTEMPASADGTDSYTVDFTVSTGDMTRWHTQLGGEDVIYPDQADMDLRRLTYTSAPLTADVQITGNPVIVFNVASTHEDGAFHVYLEDVAPDGTVTYITEGELRAIHHPISADDPPYTVVGPYHSYERADSAPLVPGEMTEITFRLYPTSVLIRAGHSLRIALAGYDGSVFARYPAEGTPAWTVGRSQAALSYVDLPVMRD